MLVVWLPVCQRVGGTLQLLHTALLLLLMQFCAASMNLVHCQSHSIAPTKEQQPHTDSKLPHSTDATTEANRQIAKSAHQSLPLTGSVR
jgi:hypothetical protein